MITNLLILLLIIIIYLLNVHYNTYANDNIIYKYLYIQNFYSLFLSINLLLNQTHYIINYNIQNIQNNYIAYFLYH